MTILEDIERHRAKYARVEKFPNDQGETLVYGISDDGSTAELLGVEKTPTEDDTLKQLNDMVSAVPPGVEETQKRLLQPKPQQDVLRAGPPSTARRKIGIGDLSVLDVLPGTGGALALDDLVEMKQKERFGLDVGMGEKVATHAAVPAGILMGGATAKATQRGGKALDKLWNKIERKFSVASPLGKLPDQKAYHP